MGDSDPASAGRPGLWGTEWPPRSLAFGAENVLALLQSRPLRAPRPGPASGAALAPPRSAPREGRTGTWRRSTPSGSPTRSCGSFRRAAPRPGARQCTGRSRARSSQPPLRGRRGSGRATRLIRTGLAAHAGGRSLGADPHPVSGLRSASYGRWL